MSRTALVALSVALFLGGESAWYAAQNATVPGSTPANEPLKISTGPYLQNPESTSMTVMWLTNRDATGWVEYGPVGGSDRKAVSVHHGLIDTNERIHKITMSGLTPGTRYQYRVWSQDIRSWKGYNLELGNRISSEAAEFQTSSPAASGLSFLVFNDVHDIRSTIPDLLQLNGQHPYDLVFFNGDILTVIEREDQIVTFLNDVTHNFATRTPFVWVRGNHETYGARARALPSYVGLPHGRLYYSFDYGPVHFVVLDTGADRSETHLKTGLIQEFGAQFDVYRHEEAQWLRDEIRTPSFRNAPFRIVLGHIPFPLAIHPDGSPEHTVVSSDQTRLTYYSSSLNARSINDANEQFGALMNEGKVDLMIAAHVHNGAIVHPGIAGVHDYPIVTGGGSTKLDRTLIRVEVDGDRLRTELLGPGSDGLREKSIEVRGRKQKPETTHESHQ